MLKRFTITALFAAFVLATPIALTACDKHAAGETCPMAGHADKGCAAHAGKPCPMNGGKPCDEACMKACKDKHAASGDSCPMAGHADKDCAAHAGKPCPMNGGKPCDEACMKACKDKHAASGDSCPMAGHAGKDCAGHAGKPCPMNGGKPCDDASMKACKDKHSASGGGCGHHMAECPEKAAITAVALDYAEGWYAGDAERMGRAVHPDLAKRHVAMSDAAKAGMLKGMTREQLVSATKEGGGKKTPAAEQRKEVKVLDVYGNSATAKLTMAGWVDYLHLARLDGKWVIVNVLWERHPAEAAAHPGHLGEKAPGAGKGDGIKTCPLSGEPVDPSLVAVIDGRKVKFCCADCIKTAKKNSGKFITPTTGVSAAN